MEEACLFLASCSRLVGQCTRLPSVREWVARATGVAPLAGVDPAEAVALGAAVHAGMLLGEVRCVCGEGGARGCVVRAGEGGWQAGVAAA